MDLTQNFTLAEFLLLLMSGGGGSAVYWAMENIEYLKALPPLWKRVAAYALSAAIPLAAWGVAVLMEYQPAPADWRQAVQQAFALLAPALFANQGLHTLLQLRKK